MSTTSVIPCGSIRPTADLKICSSWPETTRKADATARGWLFTGLAASVSGYAWSMATYDSFAFIQVSFLLFLELAFGAVLLRATAEAAAAAREAPATAPPG